MGRTRDSIVDTTVRLLSDRSVRSLSMSEIARSSGIAKGTLYNHFRTREQLISAVCEREVARICDSCQQMPLVSALECAASSLIVHPLRRSLAEHSPECLLALIGDTCTPLWQKVRRQIYLLVNQNASDIDCDQWSGVDDVVELVIRWLISFLVNDSYTMQLPKQVRELEKIIGLRTVDTVAPVG